MSAPNEPRRFSFENQCFTFCSINSGQTFMSILETKHDLSLNPFLIFYHEVEKHGTSLLLEFSLEIQR